MSRLPSAIFHIPSTTSVHSFMLDTSFTFAEALISVPTSLAIPPASAIAIWFSLLLYAKWEIARAEFSFAFLDVLCNRLSSHGIPSAFNILVRFSIDSRARLARAPAACSCAAVWLSSASMLTSCSIIRTRVAGSIDRRTRANSACSRVFAFGEPSRTTNGPIPPNSLMATRLLA